MANVSSRPFLLSDLYAIDVQPRHAEILENTKNNTIALHVMGRDKEAFTFLRDGKVKACCGWINGEIWAFLAKDMKREMVAFTRECQRRMERIKPCRAWVDDSDKNAVRWIKALGFSPVANGYWEYA